MRRAVLIFFPLLAILAITFWRATGVAPAPATAAADTFSAERALLELRAINDGTPHPVGSDAAARMRERIIARFHTLGYETRVQSRFVCNASGACALVHNVLAQRPGPKAANSVLLVAHYDGVPAGPSVSDDSVGVAALLEIARAVRHERFANGVAFLVDDGEEAGLLGAEAFVADRELRDLADVVLNVELRGTWGPSILFETSRGNRWLIRHVANALDTPQTSSLYYTIYDLLPNDSDVTVFKRESIAALNFGAIRGVQWYHTPLDDFAHVSSRTMQHHGENLLASLRTLANADLDARSDRDATWFDLLGFTVVWWPQEWTPWLALLSFAVLLSGARRAEGRAMTLGVLATFLTFLLTIPFGLLLARLARLRSMDINFIADPRASIAAMWLVGIAAAIASFTLLNRRNDAKAMLYGAAIVWHVVALALSFSLPGAAFLFLAPAAVVAVFAASNAPEDWSSAAWSVAAAVLMFPLAAMLYDALGGRLMIATAVVVGAFATTLAPLFARWRYAAIAAAAAVLCAVVAMLQPAYDVARPKHVSLAWLDDPSLGGPRWTARRITGSMQSDAGFGGEPVQILPWQREHIAPAPPLGLPRVGLAATRTPDGARVQVSSSRRPGRLTLFVRGGKVAAVNGVVPAPAPPRFRKRLPAEWSMASVSGAGTMVVDVRGSGALELIATDTTFGLPREGAALAAVRDAIPAVPIHDGDVTMTRARLSLPRTDR